MKQRNLMSKIDNHQKRFNEILQKLFLAKNDTDLDEIFQQLKKLYVEENFQHQHSAIATFILEKKNENDFASMTIAQTLRKLEELADRESNDDQGKILKTKIQRLSDHTNLECIHIRTLEEIDEKLKKEEESIAIVEERAKNVKKRIKKQQTQYITILGIFASIVLAFVGGLTFSTSVLSHMHEVSIYRLVFVICCIGFLIFNTLFALFGFILRITEKEVDYCVFRVVNGVFVAIIIINALWYEYGGEDKKQSPKQEVNLSIQAKTK